MKYDLCLRRVFPIHSGPKIMSSIRAINFQVVCTLCDNLQSGTLRIKQSNQEKLCAVGIAKRKEVALYYIFALVPFSAYDAL